MYQSIVDAEWKIIYDKLDLISESGAKVVLSKLPIGDLATQYFADRSVFLHGRDFAPLKSTHQMYTHKCTHTNNRDIFCAGRVEVGDIDRVAKATGATIQTSLEDLNDKILGTCGAFEERQVGSERYNFFTDCPAAKTATFILRGGSDQFLAESERSLHDAIMIVRRTLKHHEVIFRHNIRLPDIQATAGLINLFLHYVI